MKEDEPLQVLSRRGFLGGAAGVAVATMLPSARRMLPRAHRLSVPAAPVAGATVAPHVYGGHSSVTAAKTFDNYVGLPLATTFQKVYVAPSSYGTQPPGRMTTLAKLGCQFLVAIEPSQQLSSAEQSRLAAWLDMLNQAGLTYRISLYPELNNKAFNGFGQWLKYWRYYAPVIRAAGVPCCYEPACNPLAVGRAAAWVPSKPAPDEMWMDYYATAFQQGSRLDPVIAAARAAGVSSIGLGEWGWIAYLTGNNTMTMPVWDDYCSYLIYLAGEGHINVGANYYGSSANPLDTFDVIQNSSDPRIPMIRNVSQAVSATSS